MNELRTIFIINSSHAKFLMEEQKTPTTRIKQKVNNTTNVQLEQLGNIEQVVEQIIFDGINKR